MKEVKRSSIRKKEVKRPSKEVKRTSKTGPGVLNITSTEAEILSLLNVEFLTPKQISIRRQTSVRAVNYIIKKLREKGALNSIRKVPSQSTPPVSIKKEVVTKLWRYHALHFVIKPYYFFPRYHKVRLDRGNYGINYREWVIKLHSDMVELQLKSGEDFSSPDKWEATRKAEASFNKTLREVSNRFGFSVWKDKKVSIKLVNHHLARNPSEVARARDGEYLQVKGFDSKVWFKLDKSKGEEHEYTHPDRALADSEKIEKHFNDLLYNKPPTNSELMSLIKEVVDINKETASGLNAVVTYLKSSLPTKQEENLGPINRPSYVG